MKISAVSNASHTLAYSIIALQEMNLAYKFPIVYWNTANLIVDSGGIQIENEEEEIVDEEIDEEENEDEDDEEWEKANVTINNGEENKKKQKTKTVDYGKIASVIGRLTDYGITVSPPDINESSFTFTPNAKENIILYGLRGITRISTSLINDIIASRPYSSLQDFARKVKTNKLQMLNLIKSGAFDSIEQKSREQIMYDYIESIADKKSRITLQNMQMLIDRSLIPEEMLLYRRIFLFNKYLKTQKEGIYYMLNMAAMNFIAENFDINQTQDGDKILQKTWDNIYKKAMEPMRQYMKANQDTLLAQLNQSLYDEVAEKYTEGNISKWEMDSIGFYYHSHELTSAAKWYDDFNSLPEEPELDKVVTNRSGQQFNLWKLHRIIGTVINKDKMHNTITLLTPSGVVTVKIYKNQFALYDKQISQKLEDGRKKVLEKSWFTRGTKLMIQGIRRQNSFIPKKYGNNSDIPVISKIVDINEKGNLKFQYERIGGDEN